MKSSPNLYIFLSYFVVLGVHPETGTKATPGAFAQQVLGPLILLDAPYVERWHESGRLVMNFMIRRSTPAARNGFWLIVILRDCTSLDLQPSYAT